MNMKEKTPHKKGSTPSETSLDKLISWVSPEAGLKRMMARQHMALVGGYTSGNRSRTSLKNVGLSDGSANAEILPHLDKIRSDSRHLIRNQPLARGAIKTNITNVVGTGLLPQSTPNVRTLQKHLGLSEEQIDEFSSACDQEFSYWSGVLSGNKNCDASRSQTFTDMQGLVFTSVLESGDIFPIRRLIRRKNWRYSTAIQLVEADRVDNPKRQADKPHCHGGVEVDEYGAAVAYHILKKHPGNRWISGSQFETARYEAYFKNGEWQVLHLMFKERPEQTRGVPYLAPVVEAFMQLGRYTEAEIMAAVVSAMYTVFIKTEDGAGLAPLNSDTAASSDSDEIQLGNGTILDLAAGEDVTFANPGRPNQAFDPFVMAILRQIGVGLEIPFELLVKHFTASYSAAQAAMLEAWKYFRTRRKWLVQGFCQPVYEAVITEAVARGYISAPGFMGDPLVRAAYLGTVWVGPPRGMIRIDQEAKAYALIEDRGWQTGQEITAELTGGDWDQKHKRRVKEHDLRVEAGLPTGSNGKTQSSSEAPDNTNNPDKDED
jgi:lambda family phage portal protein